MFYSQGYYCLDCACETIEHTSVEHIVRCHLRADLSCGACMSVYPDLEILVKHFLNVHIRFEWFCVICRENIESRSDIIPHQLLHLEAVEAHDGL